MHFLLLGYVIDPFNKCDVIDIILKHLKDLKELVIWNCDWNATSIGVDSWCLTETGHTQNTLKKLVLKNCALDTKRDENYFEEIVETFPNLEELQVHHFSGTNYHFQTEKLEEDLDTLRWEISGFCLLLFCQNERFLSFLSLYIFEESVFIFQVLNDKMNNYVKQNVTKNCITKKLQNKHTFLKTEKTKFSRPDNLAFSVLRKVCLFFNF